MIPMRYIFRSRWAALVWAAGICFSAAQFAGGEGAQGAGDTANSTDINAGQADTLINELR
jgi:hypothetical protein